MELVSIHVIDSIKEKSYLLGELSLKVDLLILRALTLGTDLVMNQALDDYCNTDIPPKVYQVYV